MHFIIISFCLLSCCSCWQWVPLFLCQMFSMLYVSSYGIRVLHYIPSLSKMSMFSLLFSSYEYHCIHSVGLNSLYLCTLSCFVVSQWTTAVFRLQKYYGNSKKVCLLPLSFLIFQYGFSWTSWLGWLLIWSCYLTVIFYLPVWIANWELISAQV